MVNNGTLAFARGDNAVFNTAIFGSGNPAAGWAGSIDLERQQLFDRTGGVAQGTLKAGSGTALGTADNSTTVNSGATLDVELDAGGDEHVDLNGNFNVTQGVDPRTPKRFFLIQVQQ